MCCGVLWSALSLAQLWYALVQMFSGRGALRGGLAALRLLARSGVRIARRQYRLTPAVATSVDKLSIGVPKESLEGEKRVAQVPSSIKTLRKQGWKVYVETGAGLNAKFSDAEYVEAGAEITDRKSAFAKDVVMKIRPPTEEEVRKL